MTDYAPKDIVGLCPDCGSDDLWLFAYRGVYVNAKGQEEPAADWLCRDGNLYCRSCDWCGQLSEMGCSRLSTA